MPITPPPSPNNFQSSNKWTPGNTYSNWVGGILYPYLSGELKYPPYYQGSTTVFTTQNNKISTSNLFPDHPKVAKVASPYSFPTIAGADKYTKLSELSREELKEVYIKKDVGFGENLYKLGEWNTPPGTVKVSKIDVDPSVQSNKTIFKDTNITPESAAKRAGAAAALGLASGFTAAPAVMNIGNSLIGDIGAKESPDGSIYNTSPFLNLKPLPAIPFQDFRARRGWGAGDLIGKRLDGTATSLRLIGKGLKKHRAIAYAAASATVGAYSLFNRETLYGWGDHGNKNALRNDFTARSHVATVWNGNGKKWKKANFLEDPTAKVTAFRGDKVSVIDFRKIKDIKEQAYRWIPGEDNALQSAMASINSAIGGVMNDPGITQDFIKFFFTGPSLTFNKPSAEGDDIMVFRAIINSLTDSFNPQWTNVTMIGRADPNYHYTSYTRDLNLDFTVVATDRDELKPIWRKLNALASYTAPDYKNNTTIGLKGPWMRITIGDLYKQQPAIINNLYYTLAGTETTWDINVENDPERMEVPNKIDISMGLTLISDYLPQKGGKMYTLANNFDDDGPVDGNDNWLSDFEKNPVIDEENKIVFDPAARPPGGTGKGG
jgi:hypothetical protein